MTKKHMKRLRKRVTGKVVGGGWGELACDLVTVTLAIGPGMPGQVLAAFVCRTDTRHGLYSCRLEACVTFV